jgi:hypothetical protein
MARRKHLSKNFTPAISPEMQMGEKEIKALLGVALAPYWREFKLLRAFYAAEASVEEYKARQEIHHADGRKTLEELIEEEPGGHLRALLGSLDEKESLLGVMMTEALIRRDSNFFSRVAELIPYAQPKTNPVAPVDYALVQLYRWMEIVPKDKKAALAKARYRHLFPNWPPTIGKLHDYLEKLGEPYACGERTIRDAVKRLGFPVLASRPGRKKKKES